MDFCYEEIEFFHACQITIHSEVPLTQQEIDTWFEALEEFRNYHIRLGATDMYVKPIDYTMLPVSLLNLWKLSDCED